MTIMPSLDDMSVFASVVRAGGFSAAARALRVSKQGLSDRVARLERELGVRLLDRTTRAIRPTEAGTQYYEQCQTIVTLADEANAGARRVQVEPAGVLRIASTVSFGHAFVVDLVAEYLRTWPRMRVELHLADRPVALTEEGFDLAFWVEPPTDEGLTARPLGPALAYYVASPAYLAHHGEPKALPDLARGRCIGWATESWSLPGEPSVRIEPHLTVNSATAALQAALLGVGIARVPAVLAQSHVEDGALRLLFEGRPARSSRMTLVYGARFVPAKTRRFLELVARRKPSMGALGAADGAAAGRRTVRPGRTTRPRSRP